MNCACGAPLVTRNARDLTRKKFCSRACANRASSKARVELRKRGPTHACEHCGTAFAPSAQNQKFCSPACVAAQQVSRSYKYLNDNPRGYILLLIAKPDRKHLCVDDLLAMLAKQRGCCAVTGVPLTFIKRTDGVKQHTNLSIDRIESAQGYELGNIQLVCAVVNVMKTTLTMDEFRWWCARVLTPEES